MNAQALRNPPVVWLGITGIAAVLVFAMVLPYPLCSDVSVFQSMATQLVRHGGLPYLASWDDNFPGVVVFHALSVLLFGTSALGFRIVEATFQIATALILYRLLLHWLEPRTAFIATLFYGLGATSWGIFYLGQRDVFAAGMLIWALATWKANYSLSWRLFLSGLFFGFCAVIRPTYLLPACTVLFLERRTLRKKEILFFLGGLALLPLLSIMPYLATGTFDQYFDSTVLFNLTVYQSFINPTRWLFARLADSFRLEGFACLALLPAWFLPHRVERLARNFSHRERAIYALLLLEALGLFIIQRKYLSYQLAPFLALLSPAAAVGLERGVSFLRSPAVRYSVAAVIILSLFFAYSAVRPVYRYASTRDLAAIMPFADDPDIGIRAENGVLTYLAQPEHAAGMIEIVSYDARLRARVDRNEATRFTMVHAFTLAEADGSQPEFQRRWRSEFISKIAQAPARFVILGRAWRFWTIPPLGPNLQTVLPELDSLLTTNYRLDTTIGAYAIYCLPNDHISQGGTRR